MWDGVKRERAVREEASKEGPFRMGAGGEEDGGRTASPAASRQPYKRLVQEGDAHSVRKHFRDKTHFCA